MAKRLASDERARIEALGAVGTAAEDIAELLGRHRATVYRELDRGRCRDGVYRAQPAQAAADARARRPNALKLEADEGLAARVRRRLRRGWSPHAISADLAGSGTRVCAETIYRAAYSGCGLGPKAWKLLPRRLSSSASAATPWSCRCPTGTGRPRSPKL